MAFLLFFLFLFCDESPHLTFKTVFGSFLLQIRTGIYLILWTGFVQLIEIRPRFLVRCIMGDRCDRIVG